MKINFLCPVCGRRQQIRVFAVGWKKLGHRCASCETSSTHEYKRLQAAGLLLIGWMACWGVALTMSMAFQLSSDVTLVICFCLSLFLLFVLGGKVVDACSSWHPVSADVKK
jgi:hypothetical protein